MRKDQDNEDKWGKPARNNGATHFGGFQLVRIYDLECLLLNQANPIDLFLLIRYRSSEKTKVGRRLVMTDPPWRFPELYSAYVQFLNLINITYGESIIIHESKSI